MSADDFSKVFQGFFDDKRTPQQQTCSHVLSSQMHDEKYFCPSCRLVSSTPLFERKR